MKKLYLCLLFVLFGARLSPIINAQVTYTSVFSTNDLSFDTIVALDSNVYYRVSLHDCNGDTHTAGKPELPVRMLHLMIPFGKKVTSVSIADVVTQSYVLNKRIFPNFGYDSYGNVFFLLDSLLYNSNNKYPSNPIGDWHQEYFDCNNNIVSIEFCPFEYYPASSILKLITSATITVTYTDGFEGGTAQLQRLQATQKLYDSILYHMVDNPEVISSFRIPVTIVDVLRNTATDLPVYEYVVVAPRNLVGALHDFVVWKNQKGYLAGVVAIEDILMAYPNGDQICPDGVILDDAGSLRQYLHDAHELGTSYALLVGDASVMPIRYGGRVSVEGISQVPTDMYFSELHGNWNVNHNGYYGELGDNMDRPSKIADIYVGRLLCSEASEIVNWIGKLLQYEKSPGGSSPSYLIDALLTRTLSYFSGSIAIISNLPCYTFYSMEELPNASHPFGYEIINQIKNNHYGFMFSVNNIFPSTGCNGIVAKGSFNNNSLSYIVAEDGIDISGHPESGNGLDNLNNGKFPFILYAVGSSTIPFDSTYAINLLTTRNFGESFTAGGKYGGPAFLGYTGRSWGDGNIVLANSFSFLLGSMDENSFNSHLGVLEANSKIDIYPYDVYTYHAFAHNLVGDPECQVWTDIPNQLSMEVTPNTLEVEVYHDIEVRVTGFKTPYEDRLCRITLYSEGDLFRTMEVQVDATGCAIAMFEDVFPTLSSTNISITATCYNHIPAQRFLPVNDPDCVIHITSNTAWTSSFYTLCDYVVDSEVTLTIQCEVGFGTNNKITVEPGGKLILDGGKLYCAVPSYQWQGVRVLGTGSGGWQGPHQGNYSQGYLEIKNNAEINNARVAIDLWNGYDIGTTGGIVCAEDASFNNNATTVRARYFMNTHPTTHKIHDYNAHFYNCLFSVDEDYPSEGGRFRHQVSISDINNMLFKGCGFGNYDCPIENMADDNTAIFASDAGFTVDVYCSNDFLFPCPVNDLIYSYFNGFNMGINAVNDGSNISSFTIKNTRFGGNHIGVRTLGGAYPTILFSTFFVDGTGDCSIGVYLDNTSTFTIEENTFYQGITLSDIERFGIVVINSQGTNDIYKNRFYDLDCANYSDKKNRIFNGTSLEGLSYQCNYNSGNGFDLFVPYNAFNEEFGPQLYQGSANLSAGNHFSINSDYQFYNGSRNLIHYYHYIGDNSQVLNTAYNVSASSAPENECPSHYSDGGLSPRLTNLERQQRETDFYNAYQNYNNTKILYDTYIDGGSTSNELNDIAMASPADMWALRAQLLGDSPYLSQEVLLAATERTDIFNESTLLEILASNPEELGRDSLLDYLECNSTLPDYMIGILQQLATSNTTYRSVLESQMAQYRHEFSEAANDIVRSVLNDSVIDVSELRGWLGNVGSIDADRQIIASYLSEGNDTMAFALANMLPDLYNLTGEALSEHNEYLQLLVLFDTIYHQQRTVYELTESEQRFIDSLATNGVGVAQVMSKSILETNGMLAEIDCPRLTLNEANGGRGSNLGPGQNGAVGLEVTVKPNPATTWLAVDYQLPEGSNKALLTLYNLLGIPIKEDELQGNKGQIVIDLRDITEGVYVYSVKSKGYINNGKLVITK